MDSSPDDGSGDCLASAELYNPSTGKFTPTGSMAAPRSGYGTATLLEDGRVLVVGGQESLCSSSVSDEPSAELYDPKTGTFSLTGTPSISHWDDTTNALTPSIDLSDPITATRLADGRVLVAGTGSESTATPLATVELYDPASGTFGGGAEMRDSRGYFGAAPFPDGRVLFAGGCKNWSSGNFSVSNEGRDGETVSSSGCKAIGSAELYDPTTNTFTRAAPMTKARAEPMVVGLSDGRVLIAGGRNEGGGDSWKSGGLVSAKLYDPATDTFSATGEMHGVHWRATPTLLSEAAFSLPDMTGRIHPR